MGLVNEIKVEDLEENEASDVQLHESCLAAPSFGQSEKVEHIADAQETKLNEYWHVELNFLVIS